MSVSLKVICKEVKHTDAQLFRDIEKVNQIPIVSTMLDVICRTTGMGFAAVARVTKERWIACGVRDDIHFGLKPGDELKIETTICNEIRDNLEKVIIENVDESDTFRNHHTPVLYGFQSYISVPIILKNGEFFGTLCAIDPKPALLNDPKIIGMFDLFVDLIAFHLQSVELMERSNVAVQQLNRQLTESLDENRQYQHISSHNLQEPLRKIRMFSNMLVESTEMKDADKVKELATKINHSAQKFSMMIKDLSEFSDLNDLDGSFEVMDLTRIINDVCEQLDAQLVAKNAVVNIDILPALPGIPLQMEQLFYHLINNALKFSKKETAPVINIYATDSRPHQNNYLAIENGAEYVEIRVEDNGVGIEKSQLEKVFDIFAQLPFGQVSEGAGIGLAYCRKIIRNHGGVITAESEIGKGTTLSIFLPVTKI